MPGKKTERVRLQRVQVQPSMAIQPEVHVPQPSFGSLVEITSFKDGFFRHPLTLNPEVAEGNLPSSWPKTAVLTPHPQVNPGTPNSNS